MKQLAAILLLGIFSFNIVGYWFVASYFEGTEKEKMELALDENNYSERQLISIKQPINLPYYQNSKTFQRVDGEIEIAGVLYKYVKSRIINDSLELLCIPNTGKMKIQAAKVDFSKMASDFQKSDNKKKSHPDSKSFQKAVSEFEEHQANSSVKISLHSLNYVVHNDSFVNSLFTKSVEQPPDFPAHIS